VGREDVLATGTPVTTVQETSKQLKIHVLLSSICFWSGLIFGMTSSKQSTDDVAPVVSVLMIFVGLIWYLFAKVRIWWHHE
jgi:hypothetical protein